MGVVLQFPARAKPREVLKVPTSPMIIRLWAQLHERIQAHDKNPCDHNRRMMEAAQARYTAACVAENFPA